MDDKIFYEDIEEGAEHESSGRTVTEADGRYGALRETRLAGTGRAYHRP